MSCTESYVPCPPEVGETFAPPPDFTPLVATGSADLLAASWGIVAILVGAVIFGLIAIRWAKGRD